MKNFTYIFLISMINVALMYGSEVSDYPGTPRTNSCVSSCQQTPNKQKATSENMSEASSVAPVPAEVLISGKTYYLPVIYPNGQAVFDLIYMDPKATLAEVLRDNKVELHKFNIVTTNGKLAELGMPIRGFVELKLINKLQKMSVEDILQDISSPKSRRNRGAAKRILCDDEYLP